jgi:hypothetical protein
MRMQPITVNEEDFCVSLSYDIDDFIGDGVFWLQVFDDRRNLIYDKPFASSRSELNRDRIAGIIRDSVFNYGGRVL